MQTYFDQHCHNLFGSVFSILFISLLGYKPFRLQALLKPLKKMYKAKAYQRQFTVSGFVCAWLYIHLQLYTQLLSDHEKKKPIVVKFTNIRKVSILNEETGLPPKQATQVTQLNAFREVDSKIDSFKNR